VHSVSRARGQDTRIGKELQRLVDETEMANVIQMERKQCNLCKSFFFSFSFRKILDVFFIELLTS
jgi:hypothetical protein